jgi:acyl-CoA thioester hydrolase
MENGVHVFPLRVYYEDTDFSSAVYHASYLRFMERGRSEYLRAANVLHRDLAAKTEPLGWMVRRLSIDYLKSARVEDELLVRTRALDIGGARVRVGQEIRRGGETLITAEVEVCLVSGGKPQRIPADIRARLQNLSS